ncbi:hypothetical protein HK405_007397, partial [Cladochytrium tenue]
MTFDNDSLRGPGQADVFGNTDVVVKFVLEGHDRGVNWASFHPNLPFIVSGSDDRQIKLWRYNETKAWEVDTLRGHYNNINCVIFHPRQELIISNAEDKTISIWDMAKRTRLQTFRQEHDRFWVLAAHPELNLFAAGHDGGFIVFKLERERPAQALYQNQLFYVKDKYVRVYDFTKSNDVPVLAVKKPAAGSSPARTLSYNPAEHSVLVCYPNDGGSYELHTLPRDMNGEVRDGGDPKKASGSGHSAVFVGRNRFAVFHKDTQQVTIKDLQNNPTKTFKAPGLVVDMFYAGSKNLLLTTSTSAILYDTELRTVVSELSISGVRYAVWSPDSSMVALLSKNKNLKKMLKIAELRGDVMSRYHNGLYLGDVEDQIQVLKDVGQAPLAYLAAKTHGLDEEAAAIFEAANPGLPAPPEVSGKGVYLKPPAPILRHFDANWPQLTVARSFFEGGLFGQAENSLAAPIPLDTAGLDEVGGGDWGDDDDLDIPDLHAERKPKPAAAPKAFAPAEGEGWDLDDELDLPEEEGEIEVATNGVALDQFVAPLSGKAIGEIWSQNSQLAADHIAAGYFETAMQLLNRQIGAVNFTPLKPLFLSIFQASRTYLACNPSVPPVVVPLNRSSEGSGSKKLLPHQAISLQAVIAQLQEAYGATASGGPILFDSELGERTTFEEDGHGFVNLQIWRSFAPKLVDGASPAASNPDITVTLTRPHFLWATWARDDNLGHVLWEELATIWLTSARLNAVATDLVAMHGMDDMPDRPLARKFRAAFGPAVAPGGLVSLHPYMLAVATNATMSALSSMPGPRAPAQHVCFDELLAGGNVQRFVQRAAHHNAGLEPLFYGLRARILAAHGLPVRAPPPTRHLVLITNKTESAYHPDPRLHGHRGIHNLDEVVAHVAARLAGTDTELRVVDWVRLSVGEQLALLQSATLLVSPAGGVSMLTPFLPDGAHAVFLDYLEREDNGFVGTRPGLSVSMEAPFWNHWP